MYSVDVWARLLQTTYSLGPPTLRYIRPIGAPKVRQLEKNGYIVLTELHADRFSLNFTFSSLCNNFIKLRYNSKFFGTHILQ